MYPNPAAVVPLPPHPDLERYRRQADALVRACRSGEHEALRSWAAEWIGNDVDDIAEFAGRQVSGSNDPAASRAPADAQFIVARVHGFSDWPSFADQIGALNDSSSAASQFEASADAIVNGDVATLERLLRVNADLAGRGRGASTI